MGYVGNEPTSNFASVTKDSFSGDGSTTAFTLSKASTTNGVAVFVENVRQEPTTAHAVSGTTLTFTAAPVSASGNNIYVLHHNAPASTATHPAAQDLTAVNGTFTGDLTTNGTLEVNVDSGTQPSYWNSYLNVQNNASTSDSASITITSGTGGYAGLHFGDSANGRIGQVAYNNSDDSLIFTAGNSSRMTIDANGHITMPSQPAFLVTKNAAQSNIAESGLVTVTFETEIFDQNADFASNTFTAPVTGRYQLNATVRLQDLDVDAHYIYLYLVTSNRNYQSMVTLSSYDEDIEYLTLNIPVLADMDASDTAYVRLYLEGSGNVQVDVAQSESFFSGYLAC